MSLKELEQKRDTLAPLIEMYNSEAFQKWVGELINEMDTLKEIPWALIVGDHKHREVLASCGLSVPTNQQEVFECFMCVRAIVHYNLKRVKALESAAERYGSLLQKISKIIEAERTGNNG
jgi:hypothetical protein